MATNYKPDVDLNMTPMIDVTFLLIIFFMILIKMEQDDLEQVELPVSEMAEPDTAKDLDRLIINLSLDHGSGLYRIIVGGVDLTPPIKGGRWHIRGSNFFKRLVRESRGSGTGQASDRQVLIRADQDCPWELISVVLHSLTMEGVGIHSIQFGARKEKIDLPARPSS